MCLNYSCFDSIAPWTSKLPFHKINDSVDTITLGPLQHLTCHFDFAMQVIEKTLIWSLQGRTFGVIGSQMAFPRKLYKEQAYFGHSLQDYPIT